MNKIALMLAGLLITSSQVTMASGSEATESISISDRSLRPLEEFLLINTKNKTLRYTIVSEFKTSLGEEYALEKSKQAFQEAVAKTLAAGSLENLKGNIQEAFLKEFVLTLLAFKLINSKTQIDLHFLPIKDSPDDLTNEFSSNGLIHLGPQSTSLSQKLKEARDFDLEDYFHDFSGPVDSPKYLGGVLSLQVNIADIDLKNFVSLDRLKADAVNGFLRLRKYYLTNEAHLKPNISTGDVTLKSLDFSANGSQLLTADINLDFNLKQLLPKISSFNIYPGRIVKSEDKESWWWPVIPSLQGGHPPVVSGTYIDEQGYSSQFRSTIQAISYSVNSGGLKFSISTAGSLDAFNERALQNLLNDLDKDSSLSFLGLDKMRYEIGVEQ